MTVTERLRELSRNIWWSWNPDAIDLFDSLNPGAFRASGNNPVVALRFANESVLEDAAFGDRLALIHNRFRAYMDDQGAHAGAPAVSYFCMEFGMHESLPLYAGGLGILAGDHIKAASDLGLPFTGVGLFLRDGYFRQYFTPDGEQLEDYPSPGVRCLPVEPVLDESGTPRIVTVHAGASPVAIRAWKMAVGRSRLILLDTDFALNAPDFRSLTRRLYSGNRATRLKQEIVLGIGGLRMLHAMGRHTDVYHMNEGHCALLTFELLHRRRLDFPEEDLNLLSEAVREKCVFTTHTPVMAGHDRFDPRLFLDLMGTFRADARLSETDLLGFGRINADDPFEAFTMTVLGLKLSRAANGVSRLNGEVARRQWTALYPHRDVEDIPISHVTNGIHLPTWAAPVARDFLNEHLGDWEMERDKQATWDRIDAVSDRNVFAYRSALRRRLIEWIRPRLAHQTLPMHADLDPDALTIGFARRFATYKRAPLLFSDLERITALVSNQECPVQLLFAGKAHPQDMEGKGFIRQIVELSRTSGLRGRLLFLEDYDMEMGRMLVSGCDVWLNTPRRPYEASGTSGQKTAIHGGLNLSIPDGWWPEGFDGSNGWSIGTDSSHEYRDPAIQDPEDARLLMDLLEQDIVPMFYDRDGDNLPTEWIARIRHAMKTLTYTFSAHRMVSDYIDRIYSSPSLFANDLNSSTSDSNDSSANRMG